MSRFGLMGIILQVIIYLFLTLSLYCSLWILTYEYLFKNTLTLDCPKNLLIFNMNILKTFNGGGSFI